MHPRVDMPANEILDRIIANPEALYLGRMLNSVYGRLAVKKQWDEARHSAEKFLAQFPLETQHDVLRGSIASSYLNGTQSAAIWQFGPPGPDGRRLPGIQAKTARALADCGLKVQIENGQQVYYSASPVLYSRIRITSVWFWYYREYARQKGLPIPQHSADIPAVRGQDVVTLSDGTQRHTQQWAKERIRAKAERGEFANRVITIGRTDEDKLAVFNEQAVRIGNVSVKYSDPVEAGCALTLRLCLYHDGDLICIVDERPPAARPKDIMGWDGIEAP